MGFLEEHQEKDLVAFSWQEGKTTKVALYGLVQKDLTIDA